MRQLGFGDKGTITNNDVCALRIDIESKNQDLIDRLKNRILIWKRRTIRLKQKLRALKII